MLIKYDVALLALHFDTGKIADFGMGDDVCENETEKTVSDKK